MKKLLCLFVSMIFLSGCIPAIIASATYAGVKGKEDKRAFMSDFQKNNTERESKGLAPLDYCDELYRANAKWAAADKECKVKYPRAAPRHR